MIQFYIVNLNKIALRLPNTAFLHARLFSRHYIKNIELNQPNKLVQSKKTSTLLQHRVAIIQPNQFSRRTRILPDRRVKNNSKDELKKIKLNKSGIKRLLSLAKPEKYKIICELLFFLIFNSLEY
jgi:hypothetical protein